VRHYLPKYLVMYAVLGVVFALVSALIRFPSNLGVLIPGLLAALIGQGYVNDRLTVPGNREKAEFAVWAGGLSALLGVALFVLAVGLATQSGVEAEATATMGTPELLALLVLLFVLNGLTIYLGAGLGARGAWKRLSSPETPAGSRTSPSDD
jgi:uncharacterized transporter YbjL